MPADSSRARLIAVFLLGLLAGALALYFFLWRTGGLTPGHPLARTTADISSGRGQIAARVVAPPETPATMKPPGPAVSAVTTGTSSDSSEVTPPAIPFTPLAGFTLGREPLVMPVQGARATDLRDTFEDARGPTRRHEAIDIAAPRGTPVVAAVDGSIEKLFTSKQGGLTVYEFDRDRGYCYYYAHLDRYAEGLREKQLVHRGDRLGYVGSTGDASPEAPHLHFTIFRLGPEKQWWIGSPVNPYPFLLGTR
jgi:murein DD-endopeptidase MepM/ murein hydrolase activator NlpD